MLRIQGGSVVTSASDLTFPHQLEIMVTATGKSPMPMCGGALLAAQLGIYWKKIRSKLPLPMIRNTISSSTIDISNSVFSYQMTLQA